MNASLYSSKLVTALGLNPDNTGEALTFDLSHDSDPLAAMSDVQLSDFVGAKPKPISSIKLSGSPIFMPVDTAGPQIPSYQLGLDELTRRAMLLREDHGLRKRLMSAVLENRTQSPESPHVEEQIYGGFYTRSDQAMITEFHGADWPRRHESSNGFTDPRLRVLARRLVYREAPDVMPEEMRRSYARAIANRINIRTETTGKWLTLDEVIEKGNELILVCLPEQQTLLRAHLERLGAWRGDIPFTR